MLRTILAFILTTLRFIDIRSDQVKLTVSLGILLGAFLVSASWSLYFTGYPEFVNQLLVELHGVVLDIFVLGIMIVWINRLSEKRRTITLCKQQIEDLRSLKSEYVSLKILSCIKVLNRYKVFEIDLSGVSIPNLPLNHINLTGSDCV